LDLYPAIDILDGKAVRLRQGHFDDKSIYANDPVEAAKRWAADGARRLHIVDLDGAKGGHPVSIGHLQRICERVSIPVQYGGGLRSSDAVQRAIDAGAARVVLGTAAFADAELLNTVIGKWPDRVAVAVDVRGGLVSTAGWTQQSQLNAGDAVDALRKRGVKTFIYTNVDRDGMLNGPEQDEVRQVSQFVGGEAFLYSGGIGTLDDLRVLAGLRLPNLTGVIVGKALYEQRFGIGEARAALDEREVSASP